MGGMALQRGGALPHFEVTTTGGARVRYADIWQRQPLVLVSTPADDAGTKYVSRVAAREPDVSARDARLVTTHDAIAGLPQPAALVADEWGEIAFISHGGDLPDPEELVDWLDHVRHQCPECPAAIRWPG